VENIPGLVDLGVGYGSGEATLAYTRYLTPTGSVTPALQLFTSRWNGTTWETSVQRTDDSLGHYNPQVVYNSANQPLLVWQAGEELRLQNLTTSDTASLSLPAEMGAIDQFRLVQDSGGNLVAVFTAQGGQRDLYLSVYDRSHNLWGAPRPFTNNRAAESYPAPGLDSTGRLLMGYAVTAVSSITRTTTISGTGQVVTFTMPADGQTDLMTLSHTFDRNLTLTDARLAVSDDHPMPGDVVVISATLQNSGDWALDGTAVSFYDGDPNSGGVLIGTTSLSSALAAGYTATLTTTYTVPVNGGAGRLYAVADPADAIAEVDETDNTASLAAFGPDLALTGAGVDYWGGSQVGLQAVVQNIGATTAPTATLAYYQTAITGTLLVTQTIPTLAAGEGVTLTTPWDAAALAGGSYTLAAANPNQANFAETFTDNNMAALSLVMQPDLLLSPYDFTTTSLTATTTLITATLYNVGPVTATNVVVGFYDNWTLDDPALLFTKTVASLPPGGAVMLAGQTDRSLNCGVYAQANPGRNLSEVSYANNLVSVMGPDSPCLSSQTVYLPLIIKTGDSVSLNAEEPLIPIRAQVTNVYTTTTDSNGNFIFSGLPAGSYIVKPQQDGQRYDPVLQVIDVPPDVAGVNFKRLPESATSNIASVVGAYNHTCALTNNGGVWCWGSNWVGELGDGTFIDSTTPVAVSGLESGVQAIAANGSHTCALTDSGGVMCWGGNWFGELGNGTQNHSSVPVPVTGLGSGVKAISVGDSHTCALTINGGVLCWGFNGRGQLGNGTTTDSLVPVPVSGLESGVVAISATDEYTCAVTTNGSVLCWGNYILFSSLVPTPVSGVTQHITALATGWDHNCGLTSNGNVVCWGGNWNGQLGNGTTEYSSTPVPVIGLGNEITAITAGSYHTCALNNSGDLFCWGYNGYGQLGNGTTTDGLIPVSPSGLSNGVKAVGTGQVHTCALAANGDIMCWGFNGDGQLGDGTKTNSSVPVLVSGLKYFKSPVVAN